MMKLAAVSSAVLLLGACSMGRVGGQMVGGEDAAGGTAPPMTGTGGELTPDAGTPADSGGMVGTAADSGGGTAGDDAAGGGLDATVVADTALAPDVAPPPAPASEKIELAPYFPTWTWDSDGYAYSSLSDLQKKSGVPGVTIAFVLAAGGACKAGQGIMGHLTDVKAFIAAGGYVKASFGGEDGTYVESKCADAASLAAALGDFVDASGITDLDFDIEEGPALTDDMNMMRGQALKMVQDAKNIKVAFTLEADAHTGQSGGLNSRGQSVVSHAVAAGVRISHVNLMTMDFGNSYKGQPLAPVAIGSLTDAHAQLMRIDPSLSDDQAWAMIGVIPMIGKNDDAEVFSLDDAHTLAQFAIAHRIGLVSFWSIDRDQVCGGGDCSSVNKTNFDFTNAFAVVTK